MVMFFDLVGSTALSARLDSEDMREVIRGYQNAVAGEIARFEGHVAKFMGDGVLAYFGWPSAHEDEAERAVRAGLAITAAIGGLTNPAGEALAARVGIATGLVVVGDLVGEGAAQEQAVVGDTPNLAARLQGMATPGQVVIAAATRRLLGAGFALADLGEHELKGFGGPVPAFAGTGERLVESRFEAMSGPRPVIQQLSHAAGLAVDDPADVRLNKLEALLDRAGGTRGRAPDRRPAGPRRQVTVRAARPDAASAADTDPGRPGRSAARQPVLVVLEDAHWIDPTALEMIEQGLDRIAAAPVLLLLTSRPDRQPALAGHPHVTRLTLNRLGRAGVEAIVARLRSERLPAATIGTIIARTDGVPLFVEELTKAVLETGETAIPASLHDSLMARLDRIPEVKEVAQITDCIGREFDYPLLAAVVDRTEPDLRSALDRLDASELIFRRGRPADARYVFKHSLVQDAAYQSPLRGRRQQLHARIAEVLEERFPNQAETEPELLARHYTAAGLTEAGVHYWERAGARATERSAFVEAINHYRKAWNC